MNLALNALERVASFRHGQMTRKISFEQLGQFLMAGAPRAERQEREDAQHWWRFQGAQMGVTPGGTLVLRQEMPGGVAELPVENMAGRMATKEDRMAWTKLVKEKVISEPVKVSQEHTVQHVLIRSRIPKRVWQVKITADGGIIDARVFCGTLDKLTKWQGGNVGEDGSICWGYKPPTFPVPCPVEQLDFIFLTASPFNEHIQGNTNMGQRFHWLQPRFWRITRDTATKERMVVIGQSKVPTEMDAEDTWQDMEGY